MCGSEKRSQCVIVNLGWSSLRPYGERGTGLMCNGIELICFYFIRETRRNKDRTFCIHFIL